MSYVRQREGVEGKLTLKALLNEARQSSWEGDTKVCHHLADTLCELKVFFVLSVNGNCGPNKASQFSQV